MIECLTPEAVQRLLSDDVAPAERAAAMDHVEGCELCRALVAAAADVVASPPIVAQRYVLGEEIGRGGMGVVYLADDVVLDRKVAVKLLPVGDGVQASGARESKAMAQLRHPNVVQVYDAGCDGDRFFVAMEHVPGANLRQHLRETNPSVAERIGLFAQAAEGLRAAHAVGIVHRDFKPDNVLIDEHGRPKVADFGLARSAGRRRQEAATRPDNADLGTEAGGTPGYMPPEQFAGGEPDVRSDVFSFCVALWEALYGKRPFAATTVADHLAAIRAAEYGATERKGVPSRVRRVLERGLAAEPARRFGSMRELLEALRATTDRFASRRRRGVAVALGVAAIAGVVALVPRRPPPCDPPDDRLAAAWSPQAVGEIRTALLDGDLSPGREVLWSRAVPWVDNTIAALDREWVEACDGRRADPDDAAAANIAVCIDSQRIALALVLELSATGDVEALRGVDDIAPIGSCRELGPEMGAVGPEVDSEEQRRVMAALAEHGALIQIGRMDEGGRRVASALSRARRTGDPVLVGRALFAQARGLPDSQRACENLQEAAALGQAGRAPLLEAFAQLQAGYRCGADTAPVHLARAEVALRNVQSDLYRDRFVVLAELYRGVLRLRAGDVAGTSTHFSTALSVARARAPDTLPKIMPVLAQAAWARGDIEAALDIQRELTASYATSFVSPALLLNALAAQVELTLERGDYDAAMSALGDVERICDGAPQIDCVLELAVSRVSAALRRGDLMAAGAAVKRARADFDDPRLTAQEGIWRVLDGDGERGEALLADANRALASDPQLETTPQLAMGLDAFEIRVAWADSLRRLGRPERALRELEELRSDGGGAQAAAMPERGRLAAARGRALSAVGRPSDAAVALDEALRWLTDPHQRAAVRAWRCAIRDVAAQTPTCDRDALAQTLDPVRRAHPEAWRLVSAGDPTAGAK